MSGLLPAGFEALEPFVERWSGDDLAARSHLRDASTPDERKAFHAAAKGLAAAALDRLDARPFGEFDEAEQRLLNLMLAFAHVVLAEEVQRDGEAGHMDLRRHMVVTPGSGFPG